MNQKKKNNILFKCLIPMLLILILGSCDSRPKNVLSESKALKLMTDLELADAYVRISGQNSPQQDSKQIIDRVLKDNGVSREQYAATLDYYGRNIDEYVKLQEKIDKELQKRENKLEGKSIPVVEKSGDDLWVYGKNATFSPLGNHDVFKFSFVPDNMNGKKTLEWKLRLNRNEYLSGLLGVDYEDGTSHYVNQNFNGNNIDLKLDVDDNQKVKRVFGYIRFYAPLTTMLFADSISLTQKEFSEFENNLSTRRFYSPKMKKKEVKEEKKVTPAGNVAPVRDNRQIIAEDPGVSVLAN